MKYLLFLTFALALASCDNTTTGVIEHVMTVSPTTLTYAHGEDSKTISITHNCTCPFSWNVNVLTATGVLRDTNGIGNNDKLPIIIDRTKMTGDTLHATLQVTSNGYGTETVAVTILK